MYRIGRPFWKAAARLGVTMKLRIDVLRDDEAGVFVATSRDLPGLAVEADDLDSLVVEVNAAVSELMRNHLHKPVVNKPITDLRLCAA